MRAGKIFLGKAGKAETDIRRQKKRGTECKEENQVHQNRIEFDEKRLPGGKADKSRKKQKPRADQKADIFFKPGKKAAALPSPSAGSQKQVKKCDKDHEK